MLVHVRHVVYKAVLGQVSLPVLPFSHLNIIPQVPHTHPHFNTTKNRRSVSSIEPANKEIRFRMFGNIVEKSAYTFIFVLESMKLSCCDQGRMYLNIMAEDPIYVLR